MDSLAEPALAQSVEESHIGTVAEAPFNNKTHANVMFTTSDNVDFYLLRGILAIASPFSEGMFLLPQQGDDSTTSRCLLECIRISEGSHTFDSLMRLCYSATDLNIATAPCLRNVLEAAMEYEMQEATDIVKTYLRKLANSELLQTFVVACHVGLEEDAALVAAVWKKNSMSFPESHQDFKSMRTGASYIPDTVIIPAFLLWYDSASLYVHSFRFVPCYSTQRLRITKDYIST